ncbi:MAG: O-antigen ligase family protein [Nitrospina sp.]|nr:O-antigen ligase family protein [Nitrospina sp.]
MPETNTLAIHPAVPVFDKLIQFSLFTFVAFSLFSISVTQISFSIGASCWLWRVHLTQSWKEVRGTLVGIAILCFSLASFLAVMTSLDIETSARHLKKLLQFAIFFWAVNAVQDEKQRDLLIGTIIVASVIAALHGLYQFFDFDIARKFRVHGTRSHVSTYSGILMLSGLAALGRFLFHKPKNYWVLGGAAIVCLCLLLTLTRQAWLGFFIGTVFLVFVWNKKYLFILPLLLAGLLLFAPTFITDRMQSLTNMNDLTFQSRMFLWKGGWEIFKDHPLTGCGFKCVDIVHSQYPDPSGQIAHFRGMHNNALQLLIDTGIVGLGLWVFIWVAYFYEIFKRWRVLTEDTSQSNTKSILLASFAPVLGFLTGGFFETNFYDSEMVMLLFFIMGISLAHVKKAPLPRKSLISKFRILQVDKIIQPLDKVIQVSLYTFVAFSMFSISITQISFSIGVLAWLLKVHLTKSWKKIHGTPVGLPILCFCLASILAVITSVDFETSLKSLKKLFQFAVFFWVVNTVENERQKDLLLKLLIFAGIMASLLGFSQAWTTAVGLQTRVSGTMSIYMTFAGVLMLVGLLALGRVLFKNTKEIWVMGAVGVIAFCLLLTLTRQAWLGFFVGTLMLTAFWNKKYLLSIPIVIIGLLIFSPESVKDRLFSLIDSRDWTLQARLYLWQGGWEIFRDYPITGCGFKCVDVLHSQYPDPSGYIARLKGMHNNIIQLLVDTGILGLGTWLSIWVAYFLNIYKKWEQITLNDNTKGLIMGSLAAVFGFLAGGMFETNFYDSEVVMLLYFIMGISMAPTNKKALE